MKKRKKESREKYKEKRCVSEKQKGESLRNSDKWNKSRENLRKKIKNMKEKELN